MELPGSISGNRNSPSPHRGPEASHRISFAILNKPTASVFSAPLALTTASLDANASNAFGARLSCEISVVSESRATTLAV